VRFGRRLQFLSTTCSDYGFAPRTNLVGRATLFGWSVLLALPSHRERSHCRARVPAPLGGPELGQLRDIPPRVGARRQHTRSVSTDVCNSRFRFQSWVPFVSAHFATLPTRLRDIRFHAGLPLRRALLHDGRLFPPLRFERTSGTPSPRGQFAGAQRGERAVSREFGPRRLGQ
jgi:hypothetical protein